MCRTRAPRWPWRTWWSAPIHLTITGLLATMPHVKTGRLRLLGIGHTQGIKLTPEIPAINETVPGYYNTGWWGLIAPAGLPKAIVERLNPIMNKALQSGRDAKFTAAIRDARAVAYPPCFSRTRDKRTLKAQQRRI